jgi:ATP-dependent helicase/nuclease subunit B
MLRFFTGAAGTGKTRRVMEELRQLVENKSPGQLLVVPEQYSHEAERELCRVCGPSLSLYAEALSFSGLARKLVRRTGAPLLDKGGRLLCMALALDGVSSRLGVYGAARRRPEMQAMLLSAIDEMKTSRVTPEALYSAAGRCGGSLGDKLRDVALAAEAYAAVVSNGRADPSDTLDLLEEAISDSDFGRGANIYIDGFIDFTAQEQGVIAALLRAGARVTVCLTIDDENSESEAFAPSLSAIRRLKKAAGECGDETENVFFGGDDGKAPELKFFQENMFSYTSARFKNRAEGVLLYRAPDMDTECELAASRCIELVRDLGCRWRDIAVAVRGFEDYRESLESAFDHYGVPLFVTRRSDMLSKPLPAFISGAYEIIGGGFEADDVTAYLRTGLAGLTPEETDELENYILMWRLRGGAWMREADWRQHPDGYGAEYDEETNTRLDRINALRRRVSAPLIKFMRASADAATASDQAKALAAFLADARLAEILSRRAAELAAQGRESLAKEYGQLWELTVSALEQAEAVLGGMEMDREDFGRMFALVLSQYDVGTIPVSLDRVSAGDFDRMRRRNIKHLIVLGASDERLPMAQSASGVFSTEEKRRLAELDVDLGDGGEDGLWREFALIYNTLALPKQTLAMSFAETGGGERPSFVMNRAKALFGLEIKYADAAGMKMNAPAPAMELAALGIRGGDGRAAAAAAVMEERCGERLSLLRRASEISRGSLSEEAVRRLYGERLRLSASRIDKFASCRFAYFVQYGLRAKVRKPAGFTPPEIGTFMHYVLQHTAADVMEKGGFTAVTDEELGKITDRHIAGYAQTELNDFHEKSSRFKYLFTRLERDVRAVVADMAGELRCSDFQPLDFELDFGSDRRLPPTDVGNGRDSLTLTGIADRVDGWVHDGKLYLRVVDYKTGRKKFELSDVWYGMGLQMLLYLFSLQRGGSALYGREIVPAGVMYVPARDALVSSPSRLDAENIAAKRAAARRRSGLLLADDAVLEAMEHGGDPQYIPVKFKNGVPSGDALTTAEGFGLLARHIDDTLTNMARELRGGSIAADPYYRSQQENACVNCEFFDVCHFTDGECGESLNYMPKKKTDEVWELLKGGGSNG